MYTVAPRFIAILCLSAFDLTTMHMVSAALHLALLYPTAHHESGKGQVLYAPMHIIWSIAHFAATAESEGLLLILMCATFAMACMSKRGELHGQQEKRGVKRSFDEMDERTLVYVYTNGYVIDGKFYTGEFEDTDDLYDVYEVDDVYDVSEELAESILEKRYDGDEEAMVEVDFYKNGFSINGNGFIHANMSEIMEDIKNDTMPEEIREAMLSMFDEEMLDDVVTISTNVIDKEF